jgi:hypothetical protein
VIRAWPLRDRVELLCLAGLWRKVPEPLWRGWIVALQADRGTPGLAS